MLQLQDSNFSVIALRQGTVCVFSPRMRFDLVVNAMFKSAITERKVIVNNPSIWRPILDIRDAITSYLRAIQANYSLHGVYNVASGNYTIGQIGDMVKYEVEMLTEQKLDISIMEVKDFRNYKVTINKARTYLGFEPKYVIEDIIEDLYIHGKDIKDFNSEQYYNIKVFKNLRHLLQI